MSKSQKFTHLKLLSQDYQTLLDSEDNFSDFIIECDSEPSNKFKCHKNILKFRSDYFFDWFKKNKKNKIKFDGISTSSMKSILKYIYTGNIEINLENAIDILFASRKIYIEEVANFVEKFIKESINIENVIEIVIIAKKHNWQQLYQQCMSFIEDNIIYILRSSSFETLSEDILLDILENNRLCIKNEMDIFNSVLNWKNQPDHDISDVLNKIRFCDISPTGIAEIQDLDVLPDKTVLDLLSFQAVPTKSKMSKLKKLQVKYGDHNMIFHPRTNPQVMKSNIIPSNYGYIGQIKEWVNDLRFFQKMKLAFSVTRDGFDCSIFHKKCDNQGKTLVLIQTTENFIFGGFTQVGWKNNMGNNFIKDEKAFLFTLENPSNQGMKKFGIKKEEVAHAIRYVDKSGPAFGYGRDLLINPNLKGGRTDFGRSYELPDGIEFDTQDSIEYFAGSYNKWEIKYLEVFVYGKEGLN
ncbi:pep-cterm sorting domain-containing protein [Anaeramoeba ignava]|uniref:Pep-cterm sorting domain-containing protein n=1 Tax=Anaeramoeba ignava TaxID=1746090 RepID=A0A9Q0LKR2_ANAIG|nr:pep-cterm sorting domain-containing protein [Anaeramoeba ignava]